MMKRFELRPIGLAVAVACLALLLAAGAGAQEMLQGGDFGEGSDAHWLVIDQADIDTDIVDFNYTEVTPAGGEGGCLRIYGEADWQQLLVYQRVTLQGGTDYDFTGVWRDAGTSEGEGFFWAQVYIHEDDPAGTTNYNPIPDGIDDGDEADNDTASVNYEDGRSYGKVINKDGGAALSATIVMGWDETFAALNAPDEGHNTLIDGVTFTPPGTGDIVITVGLKCGYWGGASDAIVDVLYDSLSLMGPEAPEPPVRRTHALSPGSLLDALRARREVGVSLLLC